MGKENKFDFGSRKISFRDPAGSLFDVNDRLIRVVRKRAAPHLETALRSSTYSKFLREKKICSVSILDEVESENLLSFIGEKNPLPPVEISTVIEHERIAFPSFPYEWAPEMLYEAGKLTLDLMRRLIPEGLGLKDATPNNILFWGPNPIFIDVLSIEKRDPADPTWVPFAQFTQTFLTPLLTNKYFELPLDMIFLTHRDGLLPEEVYRMCNLFQRVRPPFLSLISIPKWFSNKNRRLEYLEDHRKMFLRNPEKARFVLMSIVEYLAKNLEKVKPCEKKESRWTEYISDELPYSALQFECKEKFLRSLFNKMSLPRVLDIGCNIGHFSQIAAQNKSSVVAIDSDPAAVGRTWKVAHSNNLNILPLVINFSRPSPSVGWNNDEARSFLERAKNQFDLVMMLAVIHHLVDGERIPLDEVLQILKKINSKYIVFEYIGPQDESRKRVAKGRVSEDLNSIDSFEKAIKKYFYIERFEPIPNSHRSLYLLRNA